MLQRKRICKGSLLGAAFASLNCLILAGMFAIPTHGAQAQNDKGNEGRLEADVHKALDHKKFSNVTASIRNGDVVLSGTVDSYADKEDADRRVHHVDHIQGVDNEIQVSGGSNVSDEALRDKLAKQLSYDRVGYGTTAFNNINIGVRNGVVTLSGTVYGPVDKDSALSLVSHTPGVKDVIDNLEVAPVSPMDDQLRLRLARAIYGDPALQKYGMDPAKPIRITVVNGNVTLSGVVDNKMDHDIAGIRANGVPGVFKVVNDLQIEGQHPGK
jgi:hyperosmotically inducible periplasmic protein